MLSYLHAYHAGGPADVHKHGALAVLLKAMTTKDKPLTYMETHAGPGLYDLSSPEAEKTGEARRGILSAALPEDHPYAMALEAVRKRYGPNAYPGSPLLARTLLRDNDVMHLMELHPREHGALRRLMKGPTTHIHRRDGFEGVMALSPPPIRRGLVLIDPSYEVKTEYAEAARFVIKLHRKWPEAVILLWYPQLAAGLHKAMCDEIEGAGLPGFARSEATFADQPDGHGMLGDGLVIINQPYGTALS